MERETDSQPQYPIGTVAQRTGLSTHVLRAWERRYGVVDPGRDEGGSRLYSNADIVRLRLLRRATEAGHPIGRVARLSTEQLLGVVREDEQAAEQLGAGRVSEAADRYVSACLEAVEAMDGTRIYSTLMRAAVALSLMEFVEGVVTPALRRVGEMWASGAACPAHEHLLSVCVQRALAWLMEALPSAPGAPVLLCTTLSGHRHELGAMLAGVVAADVGWRPLYFGPDLPAADIVRAVAATRADGVAVSIVFDEQRSAQRDLAEIRSQLPGNVFLYVGGAASADQREWIREQGITWLADFVALRIALEAAGKTSGRPYGRGRAAEEAR